MEESLAENGRQTTGSNPAMGSIPRGDWALSCDLRLEAADPLAIAPGTDLVWASRQSADLRSRALPVCGFCEGRYTTYGDLRAGSRVAGAIDLARLIEMQAR